MPPVGFEPTISAGERALIHSLDRAATGIVLLLQSGKKIGNPSQCGPSDRMNLYLEFPLLKTERLSPKRKMFLSNPNEGICTKFSKIY
jgi:hypothetical protein